MSDLKRFLDENLCICVYLGASGQVTFYPTFKQDCEQAGIDFDNLLTCVEDNIWEEFEGGEFIDYDGAIDDYCETGEI